MQTQPLGLWRCLACHPEHFGIMLVLLHVYE